MHTKNKKYLKQINICNEILDQVSVKLFNVYIYIVT